MSLGLHARRKRPGSQSLAIVAIELYGLALSPESRITSGLPGVHWVITSKDEALAFTASGPNNGVSWSERVTTRNHLIP